MLIRDGKLYGIRPHPGQGFYFAGMDCRTGKPLFRFNEQAGYGRKPVVRLRHELYGNTVVAELRDGLDFEVKVFDVATNIVERAHQVMMSWPDEQLGTAFELLFRLADIGQDQPVDAAAILVNPIQ